MKFTLKNLTPTQAATEKVDALLFLLPAKLDVKNLKSAVGTLQPSLDMALQSGDFENKAGKTLALYPCANAAARVVVFATVGDDSVKTLRDAVSAGMGALKAYSVKKLLIYVGEHGRESVVMQAVSDASYVYTTTKPSASSSAKTKAIANVIIGSADAKKSTPQFNQGVALLEGIAVHKEWANRPANHATPTMLGEAAQALAKTHKAIACEVLGPKEVAKLGMGSFMAVAQGSVEPLRFIVLKYMGGSKTEAPVVLVGKGITFDTGGISLKGGAGMDEMKFDMCGAASVLGTFCALAELKPKINVIGLIASTENMPGGKAVKPGDVVTAMDGTTIEILNTDAEGRLVLCDALTYAKRFKPAAVVDIATLTGACGVALGAVRAGLWASDEQLAGDLLAAGERTHDLAWRMPLDEVYAEGLKSNFADIGNIAIGMGGGAVTAAKFLHRFTKDYKWAHLDIAGVAWNGGKAKGATARPVALLLEWLVTRAK